MADRRAMHIKRRDAAGPGAVRVFHDEAMGVEVFRRPGNPDGICEVAFSGMRCKADYRYRFPTAEAAETHRQTWLDGKRTVAGEKQARAALRRHSGDLLSVGDVLVASWGYEQTNYNYFQVTRRIGARSVELREVAQEKSYNDRSMTGDCVPVKDRFIGEPMTRRVNESGAVKVNICGVYARKKPSELVGGVEVFKPDHYTAYA